MSSLSESIIFSAVKGVAALVRLLPIGVALYLGKAVGTAGYYLSASKRKKIAYNNLRIAFCATKSDAEIRQILKKTYQNFGQNIAELFRLPLVAQRGYKKFVTVEGLANVEEAAKRGKGVIYLSFHFGNWELSSVAASMFGYPYNLTANPQKKGSKLNELLNEYRTSAGARIILPLSGTREIIRRLQANEMVTLVVDQGGADGDLTDFFGRQASMSTGAIRIALKFGCAICMSEMWRENNGRHTMIMSEPLDLIKTGHEKEDIKANLSAIVQRLEDAVQQRPHEYMWFYKIWKYSKNVNIVIFDDGKTGHLRQSQALCASLSGSLVTKGKIVHEQTVAISYRSSFMRSLCSFICVFGQWFPRLRSPACLKIFLAPESFKSIMSVKADYIVSCGSSMAGVHFLSAPWQMAKSIVILKPGLLSLRGFDLVVLPQHDKPAVIPPKTKVVITRAAPNLITEKYLQEQTELLLKRYSHLKNSFRTKIGVLIGGNTKNVVFTESTVKIIIHQIKEVAQQLNADILLTTSRRTPEHIEQLLFRELKKFDRCALLISATQSNVPEALGGILGLADYIVVSGESISMVSEAVSSGKKTVVFRVGNTALTELGKNKYEKFVDRLNEQGYLISCSAKDVGRSLYNVMREKIRFKVINDREVIKAAVEEII